MNTFACYSTAKPRQLDAEVLERFHPVLLGIFFGIAIIMGMVFRSPWFVGMNLAAAIWLYVLVKGVKAWRVLAVLALMFVVVSLINPLLNPSGDTALFTYGEGRPYTLEALMLGMATAAMLCAMLLWFFSFNAIMTSDKLTYLCGGFAPAFTLVVTMILRLVPSYEHKIRTFTTARASLGKGVGYGSGRERVTNALAVLALLTTWAFENGIETADSMRARGYGSEKRSAYAHYRFRFQDALGLGLLGGLSAVVICGALQGALFAEYTPTLMMAPADGMFWVSFGAYSMLLCLPAILSLGTSLRWLYLRSKI